MKLLTTNQGKALLRISKDFANNYNANTLAQKLNITRKCALDIVKSLKEQDLAKSKKYGKSTFYKGNFTSMYFKQIFLSLCMTEAQQHAKRWIHQFEKLVPYSQAILIFGSAIREYKKAHDIDLVIIVEEKYVEQVREIIDKENKISIKPIHVIWQSPLDFKDNLKLPDPVLINALKFGYILHGYESVFEALQQAQEKYGYFSVPEPIPR